MKKNKKKHVPTTKNKRKAALIPLQQRLSDGQRNIPFLYKTTDETALRLLKPLGLNSLRSVSLH
jgi:hypothetical protein